MSRPESYVRRLALVVFLALGTSCADEPPVAPDRVQPDADAVGLAFALDSLRTLAGGEYHACGLSVSGAAYCWGVNDRGQLGRATSPEVCAGSDCSTRALPVVGGRSYTHIAAGGQHTCGIETGTAHVYCWGSAQFAQLGTGIGGFKVPTPVRANLPGTFQTVTTGYYHTCALATDGRIWCWGANWWGATTGDSIQYNTPRVIPGARRYVQVSAGAWHTCAIAENAIAYCWGYNLYDQVGDSTASDSVRVPTRVSGAGGYSFIAAGSAHTCGIRGTGQLAWCWGDNSALQLGRFGPGSATPQRVDTNRPFVALSPGNSTTCGLDVTGRIFCWGYNGYGEVGVGDSVIVRLPIRIHGPNFYSALAAGSRFGGCARAGASSVYCWGRNFYGVAGQHPDSSATCYSYACRPTPGRVRGNVQFD